LTVRPGIFEAAATGSGEASTRAMEVNLEGAARSEHVSFREVAVGDVEGYVHFLSRESGAFVGRVATDGTPIRSSLVRLDRGLLVQTQDGNLFALSTE